MCLVRPLPQLPLVENDVDCVACSPDFESKRSRRPYATFLTMNSWVRWSAEGGQGGDQWHFLLIHLDFHMPERCNIYLSRLQAKSSGFQNITLNRWCHKEVPTTVVAASCHASGFFREDIALYEFVISNRINPTGLCLFDSHYCIATEKICGCQVLGHERGGWVCHEDFKLFDHPHRDRFGWYRRIGPAPLDPGFNMHVDNVHGR